MTHMPASDSPRPISRFGPKRLRFDALVHDAIIGVSWALLAERGRVEGLLCLWPMRMGKGEALSLQALERSKLLLQVPIADPTSASTPQTATVTACIPTMAAYCLTPLSTQLR